MTKFSGRGQLNSSPLIGFTPSETDFLLWPQNLKTDFKCLVAKGTVEDKWISQFLSSGQIIRYAVNSKIKSLEDTEYDELMPNSDITAKIKNAGLKNLWLISNVDNMDFLAKWSKKNNLKIITANFALQNKIENKVWFDGFLKKNNLPAPLSQVVNFKVKPVIKLKGEFVLQEELTAGGHGTFFLKKPDEISDLIKQKKVTKNKKYLLRQFVSGKPYGITVFIAPKQIYLSQLRLQCVGAEYHHERHFLGLQWLPNQKLTKGAQIEINNVFGKAGKLLRTLGFNGFANFDFILTEQNKVAIIECNPRFSAATAQLLKFSDLADKIDILGTFLGVKKKTPEKIFKLGNQNFSGSMLELNWQSGFKNDKKVIAKIYNNGVYSYSSGRIKFLTPDIRNFSKASKQFVYLSLLDRGDILTAGSSLGQIMTNFPIYSFLGKINKDGEQLRRHFNF